MNTLHGYTETKKDRRFEKEHRGKTLAVTRLEAADEIAPYLELLNDLWGFSERESIPLHEIVVSVKTGGLFLSVDYGGEPAGVVQVMPAYSHEHGYHHHSNFMGFTSELRGLGLGAEVKKVHALIAAREEIGLVTWTFDPLQSLNGNLNFRKLGAVCSALLPDLYGSMGGSFDSGLPTDRLLVEWWLDSERVRARIAGDIPSPDDIARSYAEAPVFVSSRKGLEVGIRGMKDDPVSALLAVPGNLHELAEKEPAVAREELIEFREVIAALFRRGHKIVEALPPGILDGCAYYVFRKGV